MNPLRRLLAPFRKHRFETEMAEEMRTHLEQRIQENIANGVSPEEARFAALRSFGHVDRVQEEARAQRGWQQCEHWWRDLRLAARSLARSPGFSLSVFLTLVLCLGPNTAVLSTLYTLVLKPLPFPAPHELVLVKNIGTKAGNMVNSSGVPQYTDFSTQADYFQRFALFEMANTTIGEDSIPTRASGYRVTASLFDLLGLTPTLGRFFTADEEVVGRHQVIVLSDTFWKKNYQADPTVVGRQVKMGGEISTIVGIMPPSANALFLRVDFFRPFDHGPENDQPNRRFASRATLAGRLKPGISLAAAQTQLETIEERFRTNQANPTMRVALEKAGMKVVVEPWQNETMAARQPLWTLEAGALLVLLIGGVNVANLMLARVNVKRPEFAVRMALGSGWSALFRQIFCEILLLSVLAVVVGLFVGWATLQLINQSEIVTGRFSPVIHVDPGVVAGILLAGLAVSLFVGSLPFVLLRRSGLRLEQTRATSASGAMRWLSSALIVGQVALALILLIGSGLLIRSFSKILSVSPGFEAEAVVQGRVALSSSYNNVKGNIAIRQRLLDAMKEIPGVTNVACTSYFGVGPASTYRSVPYTVRRSERTAEENRPLAYMNPVSVDFFATMGTRFLEGQNFTEVDDGSNGSSPGYVVDRTFAQRNFLGRSAIGEEIAFGAGPFPTDFKWPRIVGVVDRINVVGLEERDGLPFIYMVMSPNQTSGGFNLLVSSKRPAADILLAMREKLRAIDPSLPLYNTGTLRETLDLMLLPRRGIMLLVTTFSALALILAAVGLYGVLAYDVTQRTKEIGIRGAIGASRRQIVAMILQQGLRKTALGLVLGLVGAVTLTRFLQKMLFDIGGTDPLTYLGVLATLALVAVVASWLPARRAAKVDPMVALRCE